MRTRILENRHTVVTVTVFSTTVTSSRTRSGGKYEQGIECYWEIPTSIRVKMKCLTLWFQNSQVTKGVQLYPSVELNLEQTWVRTIDTDIGRNGGNFSYSNLNTTLIYLDRDFIKDPLSLLWEVLCLTGDTVPPEREGLRKEVLEKVSEGSPKSDPGPPLLPRCLVILFSFVV